MHLIARRTPLRRVVLWLIASATFAVASSSPNGDMVLRVRLQDGSMERLQVPAALQEKLSLQEALKDVTPKLEGLSVRSGKSIQDPSQTIRQLGLKHGALLSLVSSSSSSKPATLSQKKKPTAQQHSAHWDPFPDLAKDYETAVRKSKARRGGSSFADLAHIQSSLHIVEPQAKGPLLRVYMCPTSAERFQAAGIQRKSGTVTCRAAMLFGTVARERVKQKASKTRTSLSSQPTEQDFCHVAKVQAIWEPPGMKKQKSTSDSYDATGLLEYTSQSPNTAVAKAVQVASWLGLIPVGWIFTYKEKRHDDDSLPVHARDVHTGATLQIQNMKEAGRQDGARFVTLAMDAITGATEAFQLSDVSVQMVAEDMILLDDDNKSDKKAKKTTKQDKIGRFAPTRHNILVDGKETKQLDSVLCLVNTAMLIQQGSFAGTAATTKKNGSLTNKARKSLLKSLEQSELSSDDSVLLQELSNFHTLVSLYETGLGATDCERLCQVVKKWSRGQKKGTVVDAKLKRQLRRFLEQ